MHLRREQDAGVGTLLEGQWMCSTMQVPELDWTRFQALSEGPPSVATDLEGCTHKGYQ